MKYKRRKYYNVRIVGETHGRQFESCRDAALWLYETGISKSTNAARVGMSCVLTGKREKYRGYWVAARRYY